MANKLVLLGWDAADWEVIHPMIDEGLMPALKFLIENGVSGNLATLEPVFSPILWTSVATGKRADKHGVLGFTEPDFASGGVKPVSTFSRKTAAIWNMLSHENLKSNVVGWWPSHPAESIKGCMVSNMYQRAVKPFEEEWPMANGTVFPKKFAAEMKRLRVHPAELSANHILPFIPDAAKVDQEKDKRIFTAAKILAEAASIHNAGTWLMEHTEWDFMAMYFDNIDHFSHAFMKYHPPKMRGIKQEDFDLYQHIIRAAYQYHDMMLGRVLNLTDSETTIMIISDHGFESGKNRFLALPKEAGAPAYDHRSYGIFAAMGPGIKKDELVYGASLLDITPTLLTTFDLPIGEDMDGKPLLNIFEKEKKLKYISSWDHYIKRTISEIEDKKAAEESLKMLVELGYIEKPDEKAGVAFERAKTENDFNLSRVYLSSNRPNEAIEILEPLFNANASMRFGMRLVIAYESIREFKKALSIIEQLEKTLKKPVQQLKALKASLLLAIGDKVAAFQIIEPMLQKRAMAPLVAQRVSEVLLKLKKFKLATNYLNRCLKNFPDNTSLLFLEGQIFQRQKKFETAAESYLASIGGQFFNPKGHYFLAECLEAIGLKEDAYRAYSISLQQNSNRKKCLQQLARLEEEGIKINFSSAELVKFNVKEERKLTQNLKSKEQFLATLKGTVYIVSGFPRSGTSMMMQMLQAGGMKVFTDQNRKADKNNPKGYFEHDGIKSLAKNRSILIEAEDQLVKVVAPQLQFLLPKMKYKIIFMDRKLEEVILSQHKMSGKKMDTFPMNLLRFYEKQRVELEKTVLKQVNVDTLFINYHEVIHSPAKSAKKIASFIKEVKLDQERMVEAVDPSLYRNKSKTE